MSGGAEVRWMEWGEAAFTRARAERKPIFLHIGATWCHWCHVMDQDTYPHPEVTRLLQEQFVPVRVDTDQRPDVNERYNHGGWPTAAVLDAEGQVLVGRLYMPAHELLTLLRSTSDAAQRWVVAPAPEEERPVVPAAVEGVWAAVRKAHDPYHGGFGEFEKFPHAPVAEWILDRKQRGTDDGGMLDAALAGMAEHGLYDKEEGGFFRYATQEDWNVPHYEKLLEDQARLLHLYVRAGRFRPQAEGVVRWLLATLWSEESQAFGGSQDADEAYYARPRAERSNPPAIDRTVFAGWNGLTIRALARAAAAWRRPGLLATALAVGDSLRSDLVDGDGAVRRTRTGVVGLLDDQAGVADGFVTLYQHTGDAGWATAAGRVIRWAATNLRCDEGGYIDARPGGIGLTRMSRRPLFANVGLGEAAMRLAALTGEVELRAIAEWAAAGALAEADRYNFMGAAAAALRERLDARTVVVKVNAAPELLAGVLSTPHPDVIGVQSAEAAPGTAVACGPTACARPTSDAAALAATIETLRRA